MKEFSYVIMKIEETLKINVTSKGISKKCHINRNETQKWKSQNVNSEDLKTNRIDSELIGTNP